MTVFHEIQDVEKLFEHFKYLLKKDGKIMVIDFHKKSTPMGPPVAHRISVKEVISEFAKRNYKVYEEISLGENYYGITFC